MKKKLWLLVNLLVGVLLGSALNITVNAATPQIGLLGEGTADDPYQITTASELFSIRYIGTDGADLHYELANDIDLAYEEWPSIGTYTGNAFSGYFDGANKTIRNYKSTSQGGIFGYTLNATIENLTVENVVIDYPDSFNVGALIANMDGGVLENCFVIGGPDGFIKAGGSVGGLIGRVHNSAEITNCGTDIPIFATGDAVGGLIGGNAGNINYCYALGDVSAPNANSVGGLIGSTLIDSSIAHCYTTGDVTANTYVGGLIGSDFSTKLSIESTYASGDISGTTSVGGLLGWVDATVTVKDSFAAGNVTAQSESGGFVGRMHTLTTIERCFSVGKVTLDIPLPEPGFFGYPQVPVSRMPNLKYAYYDGSVNPLELPDTLSRTMWQLKSISNYAVIGGEEDLLDGIADGWDFDAVWTIDEGESYPRLLDEAMPNPFDLSGTPDPGKKEILLAAEAVTAHTVKLTWQDVYDAPYTVSVIGNGIEDSVSVSETAFTWEDLDRLTDYTFFVRSANEISSNEITVQTVIGDEKFGEGTEDAPYEIATVQQLQSMEDELDAYYILTSNIDLNDQDPENPWHSIGSFNNPFTGQLEGNGFVIRGIVVPNADEHPDQVMRNGIFAYTKNAAIRNVVLENMPINSQGSPYIGALVGMMTGGDISNCVVRGFGTVKGSWAVGGLVGQLNDGLIQYSVSDIAVEADIYAGGLVGVSDGNIFYSSARASVTVFGTNAGGLVGRQTQLNNSGGSSLIYRSFATGIVSGHNRVGGLLGANSSDLQTRIIECYATGSVYGEYEVGGFLGNISGIFKVTDSFSTGNIKAVSKGGAFIGYASANTTLTHCLAVGRVLCPTGESVLIAFGAAGSITDSFFDGEVNQTASTKTNYFQRTTEELMTKSTYASWDFENKWDMTEGWTYPYLTTIPNQTPMSLQPTGDDAVAVTPHPDNYSEEGFIATGEQTRKAINDVLSFYDTNARKTINNPFSDALIDVTAPEYGVVSGGDDSDREQNAAAFMKAFTVAQRTGQTLYFPDGVYDLGLDTIECAQDFKMRGESKEGTLFVHAPIFHARKSLWVENLSVMTEQPFIFQLQPSGFVNLYISNVKAQASPAAHAGTTSFIYAHDATGKNGLDYVEITNCEVSRCRHMADLSCEINAGRIENNIIENMGVPGEMGAIYGMIVGYGGNVGGKNPPPNNIIGIAQNVLIKNNVIKDFHLAHRTSDIDDSRNQARGILAYGAYITIEGNYLENILGGTQVDGIYTKVAYGKTIHNTLLNAGDGQASIVHKYRYSVEAGIQIIGNRIYAGQCMTVPPVASGIHLETDSPVIENNFVFNSHYYAISMSGFNGISYDLREVQINNNELVANELGLVAVDAQSGKVTMNGNRMYFGQVNGFDGKVELNGGAVVLKRTSTYASYEIINNSIYVKDKGVLTFASIVNPTSAVIKGNLFVFEEIPGESFNFGSLNMDVSGNTFESVANDNPFPLTSYQTSVIYTTLSYGGQRFEGNTFTTSAKNVGDFIRTNVDAPDLSKLNKVPLIIQGNRFKAQAGSSLNACATFSLLTPLAVGKNDVQWKEIHLLDNWICTCETDCTGNCAPENNTKPDGTFAHAFYLSGNAYQSGYIYTTRTEKNAASVEKDFFYVTGDYRTDNAANIRYRNK